MQRCLTRGLWPAWKRARLTVKVGFNERAGGVSPEAIGEAVARVLASEEFGNSKRLRRFLEYVVEKIRAGNFDEVKEYNIALSVYDRGASFDPANDTIVRVEARRLRQKLAEYYHGTGRRDPILIELPKGAYVPVFRRRKRRAPAIPMLVSLFFTRRGIALAISGIGLLAVAGFILWQTGAVPGHRIPSGWSLQGSTLRIRDAVGRLCWEKSFETFDPHFDVLVMDKALIADIDGDGRTEVLFNLLPDKSGAAGGSLLCFEQSGALRWQFRYGRPMTFGARHFDANYRGRLIRPVVIGGKRYLLTVANHYLWYPSQVALLEAETARVVEEYWHPGSIYDGILCDVDGDGAQELVFGGINNPGEGLGHSAVGMLKIPFSKVPRRAFLPDDPFKPVTGGGELGYLLFPYPDVSKVLGLWPSVTNFRIDQQRIIVEIPLPEAGGIVFYLDFRLHVQEYRFSDNFPALHNRLFAQHLLNHRLTAKETRSLAQPVAFPAAPDGNSPELARFWKF
jgi:hypothetical protein